jgi:hypothetical protein
MMHVPCWSRTDKSVARIRMNGFVVPCIKIWIQGIILNRPAITALSRRGRIR